MGWVMAYALAKKMLEQHSGIPDVHHIKTTNAANIISGRFPMARMPTGAAGYVLTGQGAGIDPVYAEPLVGVKKVAEINVATNTTTITVTGLDILTDKFYELLFAMKNPTASHSPIALYINGDTVDTNYYTQVLNAGGTTLSAGRYNDNVVWVAYAGYNCFLRATLVLAPDGYTTIKSLFNYAGGSGITLSYRLAQHTVAQTNVTRFDITADVTGAIGAGSKLQIYGGV